MNQLARFLGIPLLCLLSLVMVGCPALVPPSGDTTDTTDTTGTTDDDGSGTTDDSDGSGTDDTTTTTSALNYKGTVSGAVSGVSTTGRGI